MTKPTLTRRAVSQTLALAMMTSIAALSAATVGIAAARADAIEDITKAGVLKVGVFEDFPPFSFADTNLNLQGYDIDVANILAKDLGVKVELVGVTGQNRIPYLTEHKVDLLLSVGQNPEREKIIDFTDAYAPYYITAMAPKSVDIKAPADLKGKTVAVNRGTMEDTELTKIAPADTDIQRYSDYNGVISAFLSGQAQVMVVGNDVGATIMAKHPPIEPEPKFDLMSSPDHIGLNKNEPALQKKLNESIARMRQDGSLNDISVKWLQLPLPKNF
jgi:polar amino acid transport system substrate-binding protein